MKHLTAILCTAAICAAIIYHAQQQPGRYQRADSDTITLDTINGILYIPAQGHLSKYDLKNESYKNLF